MFFFQQKEEKGRVSNYLLGRGPGVVLLEKITLW